MTIFDRIIEYGIIFLIVFTPLAFGSVHPWAYSTMELTICFLVIIWVLKQIITIFNPQLVRTGISGGSTINNHQSSILNRFGLVKTPVNIPIVLFIGFVVFQLIPLPSGILKSISPNTHYLYSLTLPGWPDLNRSSVRPEKDLMTEKSISDSQNTFHQQSTINNQQSELSGQDRTMAGRNLQSLALTAWRPSASAEIVPGQAEIDNRQLTINNQQSTINNRQSSICRPVSIYPYTTKTEFFKILAYIGMFFLITNTQSLRINRIVVVIISVGFCVSLLGILQKLTGSKDIYWVRDASYATHFGTYVNRNHFAGYIGMVIPLALGLLVSRFASVAFFRNADRRSIVAKFQSHFFANLLLIFVIVIMISALFLSLSRGGIMSFLVVIVAFCTLVGFTRLRAVMNRGWRIMASVLVITFIFLMWIGLDPVLNRMSDLSSPTRYEVYENTINMVKDFPVYGTGMGTFQYIYPVYKTLQNQRYYDHAHNDYLELVSDSGMVGFVIVLSGFIMFFWKTLARWWERRQHYAKGVALGGVCSVIAILAHSFTDFNLHIPANAIFLSIILGLTHNTVNMKSIK